MATKFINLTPHTINVVVVGEEGDVVASFPASGQEARVATTRELSHNLDADGVGIPVFRTGYGEIEGLPAPEAGTIFVVSGLVAAATDRDDVVSPGELVRNSEGQPIGCRGFSRPAR